MILNNYFAEIVDAAEGSAPHEITGFLHRDGKGSLRFDRTQNTKQHEEFAVDPTEALRHLSVGTAFCFVHSHCQTPHVFSEHDLSSIRTTAMPWILYSTRTHSFNFKRPPGNLPPLEGREFILGLQDCVTLVSDYYETQGLPAWPFFTRPPSSLEHGDPLDHAIIQGQGFIRSSTEDLTVGDLLMIAVGFRGQPNHLAVYLGEGLILHQLVGNVSSKCLYEGAWRRMTKFAYRHPKFTSKLQ